MIHNTKVSSFIRLTGISLFFALFGLFSVNLVTQTSAQAQQARSRAANAFNESAKTQQPLYSDYKGVRIGMTLDEARAKLGPPTQQFENQDFYVVSETQTVQIFYNKTKITAISIDYVGASGAPDYKAIVGTDIEVRQDGSMYKLVRYEQLGYWVSFNRTAGELPIVTVTIQEIR